MSIIISLSEFIGTVQITPQECEAYLNTQTGEFVMISEDDRRAVEQKHDLERYPEWQQEVIKEAKKVLEDDAEDYVLLPNQYAMNEYQMIKEFCYMVRDDHLRHKLIHQIRGSGAFRRFKNTIRYYNMDKEWYQFRDNEYKKKVIDWLEEYGIAYEDDVNGM